MTFGLLDLLCPGWAGCGRSGLCVRQLPVRIVMRPEWRESLRCSSDAAAMYSVVISPHPYAHMPIRTQTERD